MKHPLVMEAWREMCLMIQPGSTEGMQAQALADLDALFERLRTSEPDPDAQRDDAQDRAMREAWGE
jgi:hypothetical protein